MLILGWCLLLPWACHQVGVGETLGSRGNLPYRVHPAFMSCPCRGGGACLLREEYQGNRKMYEEFKYNGKTYFGPKVVLFDPGSCYCDQLSKNYFTLENGKCPKLTDFCANVTCSNGGTCRNKMGYFFCDSCSAGFGGKTCSQNEKPLAGNRLIPSTMKFAEDVTVAWYPNADFQHTSNTWVKISVSELGTEFELRIEYFGIAYYIEIPLGRRTDESKACFDLTFEDEVCKIYVKGRTYYTWNLSTKSSPTAAPYNLLFGETLENALEIVDRPIDWPFQIFAVKYPPIKISMYNSNMETFVQEFSMWSQVSSQTAGCYPEITFEGCGTDAERPFLYLPHELVKIRAIVRKRSAVCKNLVAYLRQPIEFFDAEDTPTPKILRHFKNGRNWQNDEDLSFVQKDKHFFTFGSFYTAAFGIEVLGSYLSVIGKELVLRFNAMCFFKIAPYLTEVTVEGGSGTYDCSKPVEFRPLQTDDFDEAMFTLRWSCVDLKRPNSSQCAPIETSWGSITYRNLVCDHVYRFKLEPFHDYFRLTSPSKSNAGRPFEWVVRTAPGVTHITIKCKNSCVNVNTQNAVELEANESPASGGDPYWWLYEGNATSPLPLKEYTNILSNKWLMSIRENALKPGTTYRVLAETEKGRGAIVFETNSPPLGGTCSITPTIGIIGTSQFTVTCRGWTDSHNPILYAIGVILENNVFVPIVESYYPEKMPSFSLLSKNIVVIVQDKFGLGTKYPLKVMMPFAVTLSDLNIFKSTRLILLKYTKRTALEDGVSDLILAAGQTVKLASEVFQNLCSKSDLQCSLENPQVRSVVKALMQVTEVLFQTRDPYLDGDSPSSLDWKQVHQDKAKRGATAALDGLSLVLGQLRLTMAPDFQPFKFTSGKITAFSAVGHAKTLQSQLDAFGEIAAATVKLSERSVALMGSYIYAVELIVTDKDSYFWKPPSGNILHTKFFRWHHQTGGPTEIYMDDFGPFQIPINIDLTDWDYRLVEGIALRANRSCSSECDSFVALSRLRLPTGLGAVAVEVSPEHFGKIKLLAIQNAVPSYSELDELEPHRRARIEIKFNNQELVSFFYVAVISAKEAVYNYKLKVLLSSCAYYDSEDWQSQKCAYKVTVKQKYDKYSVVCNCDHLSVIGRPNTSAWIDYIVKFPVPKLPFFSDIVLLGTLKDNWYVTAVVAAILVFYIILLLYGGIQDKLDHKKESLMELADNYPGDTHAYIVIVATGMRCRAGTSSKVGFQVIGSYARSRPHVFRALKATTLQVAQDDWFLLFTRYDLGEIHEILLWHSNTGCSTDWYCSQITVYDVYRDIPYAFKVQRWFKIDPKNLDDSRMWRGPVNKIDWEVRETKVAKVFGDRFITSLREKHLWFSIFFRHARSLYSRCERVAILGSLLFCTMLTSIIVFGSGDYVEVPGVGFSLDLEDVIEVVKGILISMITGSILAFVTLFLFRSSKPEIEPPPLPDSPSDEDDGKQKGCCRRFWCCCSKCCRREKKPPPVIYRPVVTEEVLRARDATPLPQQLQNMRFAAWVISFLLIFAMSFFIILYGLRFGKKRSVLWIQSFIGTTVFDAMIWGPMKMALGAYILASLGLKIRAHDFSMQIDPFSLWPSPMTYMQRMDRMWCRLKSEYKPPSSRRLLKMTRARAASDFFREFIVYFMFLGVLFTFGSFFVVKFNTQGRFLSTANLRRQLSERKTEGVYSPEDIIVANELIDYVNKTLLVALHRHRRYNGELLAAEPSEKMDGSSSKPDNERKGWCMDYLNKLIGVPRIRQQRISILPKRLISANWPDKYQYQYEIETRRTVSPYFKKYFNYSLGSLTALNEDTRTYKVGWELYNKTRDGNLTNLWEHYDIGRTQTGAHLGRSRRPYQGQGYVKLLYWTREEAARRFFETVLAGWMNNQTRAVMVEVTLYNVHLNMFTQFVVLAERLPAGIFSVRTLVDSTSIIIADAWTNTEMIMAYILILLLLVYAVYYFIQLSMHGVQAVMTWAGLFNIVTIIAGLICVDHNFKRATRSGVFMDTLDITPKDQFASIYAYVYLELQAQLWNGIFILLITACAVCALHRLMGYERFTMIFNPVRPLFFMTILINYLMDLHSSACYDSLGLNNLSFEVVDGFFRSIPYQSLQHLSSRDQSIIIFFLPICFIFMKTVLGAVIFYYDRAADEGPQKIGIARIFPRRVSDQELHKVLDKQDKALEKKMNAVTKKIMQISKKQKKQENKHKGELYFAPERNDDAVREVPAAGWLESVWGADNPDELADLKAEPFPEEPLPQELLDDPNLQSLLESETSQPPKRPSDENAKDREKQTPELEKSKDGKKSSDEAKDNKKQSAGIKKSKDDKKPSSDAQKGRPSTKPSGTWMDPDGIVPEPSPADSGPKKPIEAKKGRPSTKPSGTWMDPDGIVPEPSPADSGPKKPIEAQKGRPSTKPSGTWMDPDGIVPEPSPADSGPKKPIEAKKGRPSTKPSGTWMDPDGIVPETSPADSGPKKPIEAKKGRPSTKPSGTWMDPDGIVPEPSPADSGPKKPIEAKKGRPSTKPSGTWMDPDGTVSEPSPADSDPKKPIEAKKGRPSTKPSGTWMDPDDTVPSPADSGPKKSIKAKESIKTVQTRTVPEPSPVDSGLKKPIEAKKGRPSTKPSGTWMDPDGTVPEPSPADSGPKKSIEAKKGRPSTKPSGTWMDPDDTVPKPPPADSGPKKPIKAKDPIKAVHTHTVPEPSPADSGPKKPIEAKKGRPYTKPSGTWMDPDGTVPEPSPADSGPKKPIEAKKGRPSTKPSGTWMDPDPQTTPVPKPPPADSGPKKPIDAKASIKTAQTRNEDATLDPKTAGESGKFEPKKPPQRDQTIKPEFPSTQDSQPTKFTETKTPKKPIEQIKPGNGKFLGEDKLIGSKPSMDKPETRPTLKPKQSFKPIDAIKSEKTAGNVQPSVAALPVSRPDSVRPTQSKGDPPEIEIPQPKQISSKARSPIPASLPKTPTGRPFQKATKVQAVQDKQSTLPPTMPAERDRPKPEESLKAPTPIPASQPKIPAVGPLQKSNKVQAVQDKQPILPPKMPAERDRPRPEESSEVPSPIPASQPKTPAAGPLQKTTKLQAGQDKQPILPPKMPAERDRPRPEESSEVPSPIPASQPKTPAAGPLQKTTKLQAGQDKQPIIPPKMPAERDRPRPEESLKSPTAIPAPQPKTPEAGPLQKSTKAQAAQYKLPVLPPKMPSDRDRPRPGESSKAPSLISASQPKTPAAGLFQKTTKVQTGQDKQPIIPSKVPAERERSRPEEKADAVQTGPTVRSQPGPPISSPSTYISEDPGRRLLPPQGQPVTQSKVPSSQSPALPAKNQPMSHPPPDQPTAAQSKTKPGVVSTQLDKDPQRVKPQLIPPQSIIPPSTSKAPPSTAPTKMPPGPWKLVLEPRGQPATESKLPPPPSGLPPSKIPPDRAKQPEKPPTLPAQIPPGRDWAIPKMTGRQPQTGPSSLEPKKQLRFPPEATSKPEVIGDRDTKIPPHRMRETPEPLTDTQRNIPDMTGVSSRGRRRFSRGRLQPIRWLVNNTRRFATAQRRSRAPQSGRPTRPPYPTVPVVPGPSGVAPSRSPTAERPGQPPLSTPRKPKSPPTLDEPPEKKRRAPDVPRPAVPAPPRGHALGPRPQVQRGPPSGRVVPGPPIRGRPRRTFLDWLLRRR